jgi:hypothetical protein
MMSVVVILILITARRAGRLKSFSLKGSTAVKLAEWVPSEVVDAFSAKGVLISLAEPHGPNGLVAVENGGREVPESAYAGQLYLLEADESEICLN